MPSSVYVGGILMSTIAASGVVERTTREQLGGGLRRANDIEPGAAEEVHDTLADEHRVVGDDYPHVTTSHGRLGVKENRAVLGRGHGEPAVDRPDAVLQVEQRVGQRRRRRRRGRGGRAWQW